MMESSLDPLFRPEAVAVIEFGVGREIDTNSIREPIIAFLFDNKGLMYNLSLEGSKFWQVNK